MQIVTLGWPFEATVAFTKLQRRLAGGVFSMCFFLAKKVYFVSIPHARGLKVSKYKDLAKSEHSPRF